MITKSVLLGMGPGNLKHLTWDDIGQRDLTPAEMLHIFKQFNAYWEYQGEPRPEASHGITRTGDHTNGFLFCARVLQHSYLARIYAHMMVKQLRKFYNGPVDMVIGPAYSAGPLVFHTAHLLGAAHAEVEKDAAGDPKLWRYDVEPGQTVWPVTELMTTATGSLYMCRTTIREQNPHQPVNLLDYNGCLMNRSPAVSLPDGSSVLYGYQFNIETFKPSACRYCDAGSVALKPKGSNWDRLTQGL